MDASDRPRLAVIIDGGSNDKLPKSGGDYEGGGGGGEGGGEGQDVVG